VILLLFIYHENYLLVLVVDVDDDDAEVAA
jgi:hypothetical protein